MNKRRFSPNAAPVINASFSLLNRVSEASSPQMVNQYPTRKSHVMPLLATSKKKPSRNIMIVLGSSTGDSYAGGSKNKMQDQEIQSIEDDLPHGEIIKLEDG